MGIVGISVDCCLVGNAGSKEVQRLGKGAAFDPGDGAKEESVPGSSDDGNVFADFSLKSPGFIAIGIEVAEELEGRMALVIFDQVRSHLKRRIQHHPEGYLLGQGCIHAALRRVHIVPDFYVRIAFNRLILNVEDSGGIVHRPAKKSGERQSYMVRRPVPATPCVPLHAAGPFTGHEIRVGTP